MAETAEERLAELEACVDLLGTIVHLLERSAEPQVRNSVSFLLASNPASNVDRKALEWAFQKLRRQ